MSTDRDTTRIVRSWLRAEENESADRVLGTVLERLDTTPQRRATPWPARRLSTMNTTLRFGLAAVVVAVAALIGINYLANPGVGGPAPDESTSPSPPDPTPTPEASVAAASVGPEGLREGPHVLNDGEPLDGLRTLRTTVTIPAPGWEGESGSSILIKDENPDDRDFAGLITFFGDLYVYGDPCAWATTRPDDPATTVDELMDALQAQASRDASEAVDVTLDGYAGKAITLHVPDDVVFEECDNGTFGSWGVPGDDSTPYRYHQDPGQIDEVWAVDVDGELAVVDWAYYQETPQAIVDELHAIVESITFESP